MGHIVKKMADIFVAAKNKGLKNVSIRIYENMKSILYVGEKDRWECDNLKELLQAILEHKEDLSWMNN